MDHNKRLEKICRKELKKVYIKKRCFAKRPYARIHNLNYVAFFTIGFCPRKKRLKPSISYRRALKRLEKELEYIKALDMADLFLIASNIVKACKGTQSMSTRGSCGGTIVAYLLGLSDVYALSPDIPVESFYEREHPYIDLDILEENFDATLKTIATMTKKGYQLPDFQLETWKDALSEYGTSRSSGICLYKSGRITRELSLLEEANHIPAANIDPRDKEAFRLMKMGFDLPQFEFFRYEIEPINRWLNEERIDKFEDLVSAVGLSLSNYCSPDPDIGEMTLFEAFKGTEVAPYRESHLPKPEDCYFFPKAHCTEVALRYCRLMWYKMKSPTYGYTIVNEVWGKNEE